MDGDAGGDVPARVVPSSPKRRVVGGRDGTRPSAEVAQVAFDVSPLDRGQSAEFQRRLHAARISFVMAAGCVYVPVPRADDARDLLAVLSAEAPGDDSPFDENPFHRVEVRGLGTPAARWRRLVGALVDGMVFGALVVACVELGASAGIGWALVGVVTVLMTWSIGATPGKLAVGTRVRDVGTGENPNPWRAALRWGTPWIGGLLAAVVPLGPILLYLGYLFSVTLVLFSSDGRGVHDLVAGTVVVNAASPR